MDESTTDGPCPSCGDGPEECAAGGDLDGNWKPCCGSCLHGPPIDAGRVAEWHKAPRVGYWPPVEFVERFDLEAATVGRKAGTPVYVLDRSSYDQRGGEAEVYASLEVAKAAAEWLDPKATWTWREDRSPNGDRQWSADPWGPVRDGFIIQEQVPATEPRRGALAED